MHERLVFLALTTVFPTIKVKIAGRIMVRKRQGTGRFVRGPAHPR